MEVITDKDFAKTEYVLFAGSPYLD